MLRGSAPLALCLGLILVIHSPLAQAKGYHLPPCEPDISLENLQKNQLQKGYNQNRLTQWHNVEGPRALAMSLHGLNMNPAKMDSLIEKLNTHKIQVLNVTLPGHGNSFDEFKKVQPQDWIQSFWTAYCLARNESLRSSLPLHLVAYSTGATVALAAESLKNESLFQKRLLLAPALKLTWISHLVKSLFWFSEFSLPSLDRSGLGAHASTPIPAYKALFDLTQKVERIPPSSLNNSSTNIFMNHDDELVSFAKTQELVQSQKLLNWTLTDLKLPALTNQARARRHCIIHRACMSESLWSKVTQMYLKALD